MNLPDISVVRAGVSDAALIAQLAVQTFIESHGHSAEPGDIDAYAKNRLSEEVLRAELEDEANIYHLLYHDGVAVGFSRIRFNEPFEGSEHPDIAKLDRIYILASVYGKGLGEAFFNFLVQFMKDAGQSGVWLYTWKENHRAIRFYQKMGFVINGSYDFRLSPTHTNPNHRMVLLFR